MVLFASGCGDSTSPVFSPSVAAGTYVLASVTGRGPETGSFALSPDGSAMRRVRYGGIYAGVDYVAIGTFVITPDSIVFSLREDAGRSQYIWRVQGERTSDAFTIHYPDGADAMVAETYRRQ